MNAPHPTTTTTVLDTSHVDPDLLHAERVVVVGYGSQGRAHALNLRDTGAHVRVALRPGGPSWARAEADGWKPLPVAEAVCGATLVMVLAPDMRQRALFETEVRDNLAHGALLMFAHGFAVHYGEVVAPGNVDVALVAPKGPGGLVRRQYEEDKGVPCLLAVHQDATGRAEARALAYAHGIGGTRAGVLRTSFREETETDLFGEQAVLCGGVTELVTAGFETLTEAGYAPEVAYFECLHELKLIVDLLHEGGLKRMHEFVSETAQYGDLTRGPRVVDARVRENMKQVLTEIQDGTFARQWLAEDEDGRADYDALMRRDLEHPMEQVGSELRARMSWLQKGNEA